MNNSIPQFEEYCTDLTKQEKDCVSDYLNTMCPPGEADYYRNYFFRLYWLARKTNSKKIVELGCIPGGSTLPLLWAAKKNKGHVWSCDISDPPIEIPFSNKTVDLSLRTRVGGVLAKNVGNSWSGGKVDFVYLDTGHEYLETIEEIKAWIPHIVDGGLFVFHDSEIYKGSVFKAISEHVIATNDLFELHHFPDCHGHCVIQFYRAAQTSTFTMKTLDNVVSLTHHLLNPKTS